MNPKSISICKFQYSLPDELIARHPLAQRDACRLLVADNNGRLEDHIFSELPDLLPARAMLVYNNTRVVNARIFFRKPSGAHIEIFCLEPETPSNYEQNFAATGRVCWHCLVGNSKKWKDGILSRTLEIDGKEIDLCAKRISQDSTGGSWVIEFSWSGDVSFARVIEAAGVIPIPPYLNRETESTDSDDYQTIFSRIEGSVAAPTAGLHFTPAVLDALDKHDILRREVTLHVGAGTFRPVKSEQIGDHPMHSEYVVVSRDLIAEMPRSERPIIAVGTTSVRTLESLYHIGCLIAQNKWDGEVPQWYPYSETHPNLSKAEALNSLLEWLDAEGKSQLIASTRIIIAPGYQYRVVEGMVTNFHQPGSTLLLLVSAFIGDSWENVYAHALKEHYRFLSYGDACLFLR